MSADGTDRCQSGTYSKTFSNPCIHNTNYCFHTRVVSRPTGILVNRVCVVSNSTAQFLCRIGCSATWSKQSEIQSPTECMALGRGSCWTGKLQAGVPLRAYVSRFPEARHTASPSADCRPASTLLQSILATGSGSRGSPRTWLARLPPGVPPWHELPVLVSFQLWPHGVTGSTAGVKKCWKRFC